MKNVIILIIIINTSFNLLANLADEYQDLRSSSNDPLKSYLDFAEEHSNEIYGQKAFLEAAKIEILRRNYNDAIKYLNEVHNSALKEKYFWLAKTYLKIDKYHKSIMSSQVYITDSDNRNKIEIAYFLIAEAYIQEEMYKRALRTLETLKTSKYINNNIPYLHFKIGNCYELMGRTSEALMAYKKLKVDFPYTHLSYLAEDRLIEIAETENLPTIKSQADIHNGQRKQISKSAKGEDMKIYLQIGAFNSEQNAKLLNLKVGNYGYETVIFSKIKNNTKFYVVAVGPFEDDANLKKASKILKENNLASFVIKRY